MATNPPNGLFIPTVYLWDVSSIYEVDVNSQQFKEIIVRLYQNVASINIAINQKDTGLYDDVEFVNAQKLFPKTRGADGVDGSYRPIYRMTVNFGALPNTATKSVAHGITGIAAPWSFTRIYGTASDTTAQTYIPIPYASTTALANNIEITVDATNVNIITAANYSAYDTTYVILEYVKW
jgi:hypothetical protein